MKRRRQALAAALALELLHAGCDGSGSGLPPSTPPPGDTSGFPAFGHVEQSKITRGRLGFRHVFDLGDELFEAEFTSLDGVGALALPDGTPHPARFSRVPPGGGRFTGPNAQSCDGCHNSPFPTSAGEAASNVLQDPAGAGVPPFNGRNTPSLFGAGSIQRLAEEMTEALQAVRDATLDAAQPGGPPVTRSLSAKGVEFGSITVRRGAGGEATVDVSGVEGVDPDLVVRPFGWKGNIASIRDFSRGAARNELGMEPDELVAKDPMARVDPDGDDVVGELSVGDITAITVYVAAQETPAEISRLVRDGLVPPLAPGSAGRIERGGARFSALGCERCHVPELRLADAVFAEPTLRGGGAYADPDLDPLVSMVDPARPLDFHLAREGDFPRPEPHPSGGVRLRIFGDLKRHAMGRALADAQPTASGAADGLPLEHDGVAVIVPAAVFLTAELWGTGNTGPWLHDGRAGSLEEAILLHGEDVPPLLGEPGRSEAQESRDAFAALGAEDRLELVEFLKSLVLFSLPEE